MIEGRQAPNTLDTALSSRGPRKGDWASTARRSLIATTVAVGVIAGALALWELKLVIALVFLAVIIAAAMRPGVEALRGRGIPRGIGVGLHYVGFDLVDARLGAFVRGEIVLMVFVATLLSFCFWLIGEPYWLLLGIFAGVFELVPLIGPLAAGAVAIGVGFTVSWHVALAAALAVVLVRLLEDYLVTPRLLGHAVGLSPLLIIVSVLSIEVLFGGTAVLLAIPIAAVLATVVDVTVRGKDPAEEDVPTILFMAQDSE